MADGSTSACKKAKYVDVSFSILQKSFANIVCNSNNTTECTRTNNATLLSCPHQGVSMFNPLDHGLDKNFRLTNFTKLKG